MSRRTSACFAQRESGFSPTVLRISSLTARQAGKLHPHAPGGPHVHHRAVQAHRERHGQDQHPRRVPVHRRGRAAGTKGPHWRKDDGQAGHQGRGRVSCWARSSWKNLTVYYTSRGLKIAPISQALIVDHEYSIDLGVSHMDDDVLIANLVSTTTAAGQCTNIIYAMVRQEV